MANERVSWGLNIDALKDFEVVPNGLCRNTTFQHYACTISHMLIIYQAYMRNEVCTTAAGLLHAAYSGGTLPIGLQSLRHQLASASMQPLPRLPAVTSASEVLNTPMAAAEHAAGPGGRHGDPALARPGPAGDSAPGLGDPDVV